MKETTMATYNLKTRQPTGRVPWPLILVEGPEKAGKSYAAALLSASDRIGHTYWIDLAEGSADEYGAIPGARYLVVDHDGTWGQIYGSIEAVYAAAEQAAAARAKPIVLVVDSMTAEWDMLKDWASNRAKSSSSNRRKLAQDPHAEITVSANYWNDANSRHRKLMRLLMTFPGIVVMTARGKWVAVMGDNGQPIEGKKEYRVEGQKNLAFDASCWVRLDREKPGSVIGLRSVHAGIRPGHDDPRPLPADWTLEWLIFDELKCDPNASQVRDLTELQPGADAPDSPRFSVLLLAIETAPDLAALRKQWEQIQPALNDQEISETEAARASAAVTHRKTELEVGADRVQANGRAPAEAQS
jgi:hypothetical protein